MLVLARVCLVFGVKLHQPTGKRNSIEILREAVVQGQAQEQEGGGEAEAAEPPPLPLPGLSSLASHRLFWHFLVDHGLSLSGCYD